MMIAMPVLAVRDNISQYLTENYNVITVVTIHYLFFLCFTLAYSSCQKDSGQQRSITITGSRLAALAQICVAILSFSTVGLINFHAVFASYPLMVITL